MTRFDDEAAIFNALTADLETGASVHPHQLPMVPRDGKRVLLNAFEGEDLRAELLASYALTVQDMQEVGLVPQDDRSRAGVLIADGIEQVLLQHRQGEDVGELFAIQGTGFFGIPKINPNGEPGLEGVPLWPGRTFFGVLAAVGYGEYWTGSPSELMAFVTEARGLPQITQHAGALLCMTEVAVCRTGEDEGYGPVDQAYDQALVPIHDQNLRFFRAYAEV